MRRTPLIAALSVLLSTSAFAHTHLAKSVPANGSVLTQSPAEITLQFEHEVRVTEFKLQKGEEKDDSLLKPLPQEKLQKITAVPPKLTPGAYVVSWRAIGPDGHVMNGSVRFTLSAGAAPAAKSGDPAAKH